MSQGYNNSLLYYKTYYSNEGIHWIEKSDAGNDENKDEFSEKNKKIFSLKNKDLLGATFPEKNPLTYPEKFSSIQLRTTYPGLLLGSGIAHGSGLSGEFKLGFYFDYTTGLPVILGSSVKGLLRSAFPLGCTKAKERGKKTDEEKQQLQEKANQLLNYIQQHLNDITNRNWSTEEVNELETFLFGSYEAGTSVAPMSHRIIFHDAIPDERHYSTNNKHKAEEYLGDDFITPHNKPKGKIPAALRNPIPIAFIKVLPGITFCFQFVLRPFQSQNAVEAKLSVEEILKIFTIILLDFGIGAKTNTGYGHLEKVPKLNRPTPAPAEIPENHKIFEGKVITGRVSISTRTGIKKVELKIKGKIDKYACQGLENFNKGDLVSVEIIKTSLAGGISEIGNPQAM